MQFGTMQSKKNFRKTCFIRGILSTCIVLWSTPASFAAEPDLSAKEKHVTIGSGPVVGTYYPVAGVLCQIINAAKTSGSPQCVVQPSTGSADNIELLRSRRVDMALVQSMVLDHAYKGQKAFEKSGEFKELRSVLALHPEPLMLIVSKESEIKNLKDLAGKRVSIGVEGSFQREMVKPVLEVLGWSEKTFSHALEIEPAGLADAICSNRVDAVFFAGVQPQEQVLEMLACGGIPISVVDQKLDALLAEKSYFTKISVPLVLPTEKEGEKSTEKEQETAVETFGTYTVLVTTTDLPEQQGHDIVKQISENFESLTILHPALADLEKTSMKELSKRRIPAHAGVEKYTAGAPSE